MAAQNYYGFTPGGTLNQYSSYGTPAAAYQQPATQSPYSVAQSAQYGPYGNRIQTYDEASNYYSAQAASAFTYGASAGSFGQSVGGSVAAAKPSSASSYYPTSSTSASSAYYASQSTAAVTRPSSGKKAEVRAPDVQTLSSVAGTASGDRRSLSATSWQPLTSSANAAAAAATGAAFTSYPSTTTSANSQPLTGLDKALFTIAANYCQSQKTGGGGGGRFGGGGGGGGGAGGTTQRAMWWNKKGKMPTDPSQWKYCELCKMTCPGTQAYKLHLEGKIHKKKESMAAAKSSMAPKLPNYVTGRVAFCSICETYCSSKDAYAAHVRGIKHLKVIKLMQRLGKPIPDDALVSEASTSTSTASAGRAVTAVKVVRPASATISTTTPTPSTRSAVKKVYCAPRINFVGGTQLKTTGGGQLEEVTVSTVSKPVKAESSKAPDFVPVAPGSLPVTMQYAPTFPAGVDEISVSDAQPVGLEYIEEGMNEARTAPSFYCKLCECSFTDVMGKMMHSKGRRHRLSYKKKVDPTLRVEVKVNPYDRRALLEKMKRNKAIPEAWRKRELQATYRLEAEELRYEKEVLQWKLQEVIGGRYVGPPAMIVNKPWAHKGAIDNTAQQSALLETVGRSIQTKHMSIYPTEAELTAVQTLIAACEKALKLLSDFFAERDAKKLTEKWTESKQMPPPPRMLKGVMRVGLVCKGLLLQGSLGLQLVVLCADLPTQTLVKDIADNLPVHLLACGSSVKYEVATDGNDLLVTSTGEKPISCTISFTSPAVKNESGEETVKKDLPEDVLNEDKCILLLAELRHAKWFQAKVSPMQSCLVVIRILMDVCNRVPAWSPISQWSLELLVEKCATSVSSNGAVVQLSPTRIFLRVLECISAGILLPGGPGLYDVCEKDPSDALAALTNQEREDLTAGAQLMLRQILCGRIDEALGIDTKASSANGSGATVCKRPRISSA